MRLIGPPMTTCRFGAALRRLPCSLLTTLLVLPFFQSSEIARAQDVQVTASIGTDTVGLQEQFELTISVSGPDSGDAETPRLPRLTGFQVLGGPNVSSQFQWVNGRVSSSRTFSYILLPQKEGNFTIEPVEVSVGGKTYRTGPVPVRVVPGPGRRPAARPRMPDAFGDEGVQSHVAPEEVFVTAQLDRNSAYTGQQVTLTYHLFTRVGITGLQLQESPPLSGFWVEDLEVPKNPTSERRVVNGREYAEFIVKKQALFPTSTGQLKIPPSTFAVSAKTPGDFFGMFGATETVYRKTQEVALDVQPLPENGRPPGFTNAVGSFNLTTTVDKTQTQTGDAVSWRIKLEGRGNLKMIPDLSLPPLPDFTVYSSKRADNIRPFDASLIGGDKTWEYIIVPKAPGQQVLPALSFSYFDPERRQFQTVSTQSITLNVVRGNDSNNNGSVLAGINKQNITRQGTDINFIKLSPADLRPGRRPAYLLWWFYLLAALPVSFNVGAYLYQKKILRESGDLVFARSRRARRTALARLKKAEAAGHAEPRRFYDEAALAFSGYLADRFNLPEIAVTRDSLERTLADRNVAADTVAQVVGTLQECDFGRFVAPSASAESKRLLVGKIRGCIDTLEVRGR